MAAFITFAYVSTFAYLYKPVHMRRKLVNSDDDDNGGPIEEDRHI